MSPSSLALALHLFLQLTFPDEIWYHSMKTNSGWTQTPQDGSIGDSSANCYSSACVVIKAAAEIQYDGIDTTNYHNIQLKYSIAVTGYDVSDICTIAYSIDEINWTDLVQYDDNDNDRRYDGEIVDMNADASHQSSLSIRFKTDAETGEYCYADELYLYGIPPTQSPSRNPTHSATDNPSKSPTNIPTDNPTNQPTYIPTNNPTNIPTHNPTNIPTNMPSNSPSNVPSNIPTNMPSNIPSNIPSNVPTNFPTNFPTNTLNFETKIPTNRPSNTAQRSVASTIDMALTKSPTLSPNVASIDHNVLSNEYMMSNWYYLMMGAVVFLFIFCVIVFCFALKMRKMRRMAMKDTRETKSMQNWNKGEVELQLQNTHNMHVLQQQQIARIILNNNAFQAKQLQLNVGQIQSDEEDIEDMWDDMSNTEDTRNTKGATSGNENTAYNKNRMSVHTVSDEGSHVIHINAVKTNAEHKETPLKYSQTSK